MTTPINIPGLQLEGGTSAAGMPTTVLCLMNMVSLDELRDDEEYEGVCKQLSHLPLHENGTRAELAPKRVATPQVGL